MIMTCSSKKIILSANAGLNHTSTDSADPVCLGRSCDLNQYNIASIQLVWSGLTGTLDGVLSAEVSNDNINWETTVSSGIRSTIIASTAAGTEIISLDGIADRYYRAKWTANGVTGGIVTCILVAKGSDEYDYSININNKMPSITGNQIPRRWIKPLLKLHITNANINTNVVQFPHGVTTAYHGYAGAVFSPTQNRIYFVPYAQGSQANWHYVECATGKVTAYAKVITAVASAYTGGVYDPTLNRIYLVPFAQGAQSDWHYIDCNTGLVVAYAHGATVAVNPYYGGVYSPTQKRIYLMPYGQGAPANTQWHYIDCTTGLVVAYTHNVTTVNAAYFGGVYSPNQNRIYMVPHGQATNATWHYIDCSNGTVVPYPRGVTGFSTIAYCGGVFSPLNNRIYLVPSNQRNQANFHYIDCNTGLVTAYARTLTVAGTYIGGVYSPTKNRIYLVPNSQAQQTEWHYIDCDTGQWIPYTHGITAAVVAYIGGCYSPTLNRIYLSPDGQGAPANTTWHYIQMTGEDSDMNPHQFGSTILSSTL